MKHYLSLTSFTALIFAAIMLSSCNKEVTQNPVQQNTPATHYLKGLLGDEEIMVQTNASYFTDVSNQNDGDEDDDITGDHNNDGHPDNGDDPDANEDHSTLITGCEWHITDQMKMTTTGSVELRKEVFRIYVTPFMNNQYYGMLAPGTYNFAYQNNSSSGAYITLRDKSGVLWTSKGDQTGSSFQITSRGASKQTFTTITGTVHCKMYDSNGNMKLFTGGSFTANSGL